MRCSNCGSENAAGKRFCGDCGARLANHCPKCGAHNPAGKRFCGDCGALLDSATPAPAEPGYGDLSGERRHLTVLFCDLVNSTSIAAQLDPEEWRETVGSYHRAAAEAITRYGGHVAKYLGDGVMAYFGWPEAHDNDAERAARAGLAVLEEVSKLNQQSTHPKMSVRVGIDSGAVVVGAGAGKDTDVFGEAPNIAARVQAVAAPGTVLLTASTHRLVSGLFVVEERGAQELKGVADPVELYRVLRPTGVRGRLAAARGLTPFVGREEELRLLLSRWERACEGEGQLVLVVGEAGIGKSRLVAEFHDRIRDTPHIWMESAGEQFFQNTPFHAITEMLSQWLELQGGTNRDNRVERLERAMASAGLKPDEAAPLVADLLQLPVADRYQRAAFTPEQKRGRLLAVLTGWTLGAARLQPMVMVVEDLHWLDPSTLELQQLLAEQAAVSPLMLLYTARSEFHQQWPLRSHHTQITLNRLSVRDVQKMIAQVASRHALTRETLNAVVERTSGVPLFVEELTRAVLESGDARPGVRAIPESLHDSLMARLDRLGTAKEVAQLAAVIGAEFSYQLLDAVSSKAEGELQSALAKLTDAELIYPRGIPPDATYQFKHALIRDTAYEALLKSRRRELHRLVARTIDEKFKALSDTQPEVLAHHWTEAGETDLAITQWSNAGRAAEERNAFHEAQESYQRALGLLNLLPESPERDASELQFRQSLVSMLQMTRGWAAPETVEAAKRAGMLAEKSGNLRRLIGWMTARCLHAYISGDLFGAAAQADQALELALREGKANMLAHVYTLQLRVRYHRGNHAGAEECLARGLTFFDDPVFRRHPNGVALSVFATASWNAWVLGRPDVGHERMAQSIALVNPVNPHDLPWSDIHAAMLRSYMRENEQAAALAVRALELCEKHNFPNEASLARGLLGLARARLGHTTEGIALIREGIAGLLKAGNRISATLLIASLAEAQNLEGAIAEALDTIEQALQLNPDELAHRPETLRVRGELRLKKGQAELAEADFRDSISLARSMGAKAWELRTIMSLAHLLEKQGRREEARAMLAEIYGWFTEGFDTADLKEAKVLLDELNERGTVGS
jgi:class 3 adenylate cyclase/tetratricopeptide (TPR) repeat protein